MHVSRAENLLSLRSPGYPLGLFPDYSDHETELSITIREKEQNWLEVVTSDGQIYMSIIGRDRKVLFDNQGNPVLNVRNKTLNFGGEYQVSLSGHMFHRPPASD
jgi:hypothetical protein